MQQGDEEKNKLEKLQGKLDSRNAPNIINGERTDLSKVGKDEYRYTEEGEVKESWQDMKKSSFDELAAKVSNMAQKKNNFVKKVFLFSVLFFVISAAVAAFVFFGGINMVSSKNVDIKVVGPMSVGSGQEASFDINVINNNNVDLRSASLLVEYPAGTRYAADLSKELTQERYALDTIKPGKSFSQNVKAVFFGDKDASKEVKISLEYRVENSSALFYKEKAVEVKISSAPVILTPTYPKEVNSNQDISFNVEVVSNSKDRIGDFLVKAEYPFGFTFKDASPRPTFGNNVWQFSELPVGAKKNISIKGSVVGQDDEERVFKISAGTASSDDERVIAVPFSELTESIMVKKPFINLEVAIDGKNSDAIGQGGNQMETELVLRNNLPSRLFNTAITVALRGGAFNGLSVSPSGGGFFQSFNNTILWDKRSDGELADLGPGEEKSFSFRLTPLAYGDLPSGAKPEIEIVITARGERISESGAVEEVSASETRKITLGTNLSLSTKVARSVGSIENYGPIPPKANVPTAYTVIWSIANSSNQVSNVTVRAALPSYVKWTQVKSPESEALSYNSVTNELIWNAGSILPGGSSKKELYFQLELMPSTSQIGQAVSLLGEASISGIDKVTGQKIEKKAPGATTNFSGDPSFRSGDDRVAE